MSKDGRDFTLQMSFFSPPPLSSQAKFYTKFLGSLKSPFFVAVTQLGILLDDGVFIHFNSLNSF